MSSAFPQAHVGAPVILDGNVPPVGSQAGRGDRRKAAVRPWGNPSAAADVPGLRGEARVRGAARLGVAGFLLTALLAAACGPAREPAPPTPATAPSGPPPASRSSAAALPVLTPGALPQATLQAPAPGSLQLADLQLLTPAVGWAVGSRCAGAPGHCTGAVLATSDGGATWSALPAPPSALVGLQFVSTSQGWVWGPDGAWATADGGRTWSPLSVPAGGVSFLDFVDAAHGWMGAFGGGCGLQGCGAAVYATSDGGRVWRNVAVNAGPGPVPPGARANLPWVVFRTGGGLSASDAWLFASDPGAVYVTADGGSTWNRTILKGGASGVAFQGTSGWVATEGCIPGPCTGPHANDAADLYRSADGGRTWTWAAALPGFPTGLSAAPGGAAVWVLDQPANGTVYCDGRSCATRVAVVSPGTAPAFHTLHGFALLRVQAQSATSAWAVGSIRAPGDSLLHTSDGGQSWTVAYAAHAGYLPGPVWGFWTANTGWALGASTDATAVLTTALGGRTWRRAGTLPDPLGNPAYGGFVTPEWGWALTDQGALVSSADGGAHWAEVGTPRPCGTIEGMGFVDPDDGWLLAGGGTCAAPTLYRSADGGRSWTAVPASAGTPIAQVAFATPQEGWARLRVGGASELARTADGGCTWQPVATLDSGLAVNGLYPVPGGVWVTALRPSDGAWVAFEVSDTGAVTAGFSVPGRDLPSTFQFQSAQVGWMQADGVLFATGDGGAQFQALS